MKGTSPCKDCTYALIVSGQNEGNIGLGSLFTRVYCTKLVPNVKMSKIDKCNMKLKQYKEP